MPISTSDGRYVFFASSDGWITKLDILNRAVAAQIQVGSHTRNMAISGDGKYLAVANDVPRTLVLLDAHLNLLKVHEVKDKNGKQTSRVSAVYDAPTRKSFIAALKDVAEVWEISYNPTAADIPAGMIHDFQYKEGAFLPGFLNPQRTYLSDPLDDFIFMQGYDEIMGIRQEAKKSQKSQVINLDTRKKIAEVD